MNPGALLFGLAIAILVGIFLARPFLTAPVRASVSGNKQRTNRRRHLLEEKEALLAQIKELDFDHDTGKVPSDIYDAQRQHLLAETANVMQALDTLPAAAANGADTAEAALDARIEAALAQLRGAPAPALTAKPVAKAAAPQKAGSFCPQCGNATDPGDKFCTTCGHKLELVVAT